ASLPPRPAAVPNDTGQPLNGSSRSTRNLAGMNAPGSDGAAVAIPPEVLARRWWILVVLCTSLMIVIVGNTALNVALPTLSRELDASTSQLQWMVDGYGLVF